MSALIWEKRRQTAWVTMNNGENRHNPDFLASFLKIFDEIEADPQISAVVLASGDPKFYSLGIDLEWIMSAAGDPGRHDELRGFLFDLNAMFRRLLTFPAPVIAAMGGHAFGDGAIMACACDFRLMRTDRGFFCFPEVDLSIPFLPGMDAIVRKAVPSTVWYDWVLHGKKVGGEEAARAGVVLRACDGAEALEKAALELAESFGKKRAVTAELKKRAHAAILRVLEEDDPPHIRRLQLVV